MSPLKIVLFVLHVGATGALTLPPTPFDAKRLILVRHGSVDRAAHEPPIPDGALYGGNLEVPLSAKGKAEAAAAAEVIGQFAADNAPGAVHIIASSPMERAVFGADRIAEAVSPHIIGSIGVSTYPQLKEIDRGDWVNLTREQIAERYGADAFERAALEDEYGRTFNGEGMGDLRERVMVARDFVLQKLRPGAAAVIVSHMWVTRAMVADALGEDNVLNVDIPTASISVLDYGPTAWPTMLAEELPQVPIVGWKPEAEGVTDEASKEQQQQ